MAIKVGGIFVDFEARTLKFEKGVDTANVKLGKFNKTAKRSRQGFGKLDGMLGKTGASFARFAAPIASAAGLLAGFNKVIDDTSKYQTWNAQLETATGSSEKAAAALEKLQKFALKTPFAVDESIGAFTKLTNLGLNPSERALTSYGNTAAAMGKSMEQMIEAVADASTFEFERLKEFGIKASQKGDEVKFTFRGITTTVKKESAAIQEYLLAIGETNFAGAMDKQAGTLKTSFSNLGAAVSMLAAKFGEESGLAKSIAEATNAFTDFLNKANGLGPSRALDEILFDIDKMEDKIDDFKEKGDWLNVEYFGKELNKLIKEFDKTLNDTSGIEPYAARLAAARKELAAVESEYVRLSGLGLHGMADDEMLKYHKLEKEIKRLETVTRVYAGTKWQAQKTEAVSEKEIQQVRTNIISFEKLGKVVEKFGEKTKKTFGEDMLSNMEKFNNWLKEIEESQDKNIEKTDRWKQGLIETFAEGIARARDFGDVLESVLEEIKVAIIKTMLLGKEGEDGKRSGGLFGGLGKIFGGLFGGGGGNGGAGGGGAFGGIGDIIGGILGFADGGRPPVGRASLVGERGPELFAPDTAGTIIPNHELGGTVNNFNIMINAEGADRSTLDRLIEALPEIIDSRIVPVVANAQRRGVLA